MLGVQHGESMYKKWYFEVEIDFIEILHELYEEIDGMLSEFHIEGVLAEEGSDFLRLLLAVHIQMLTKL